MEGFKQAMNAVTKEEAFGKLAAVILMFSPVIIAIVLGV